MNQKATHEAPTLRRRLGLWMLALYGLGNILGAGIYVLVGEVAGEAGVYTPLAFLIAAIVAGMTALSYAELSARYPEAAGVAVYIQEGFGNPQLSTLVGVLIGFAGMFSAATLTRGFAGYAQVFFNLPGWWFIVAVAALLTALAIWGIAESVGVAALLTIVEAAGLVWVIIVGAPYLEQLPEIIHSALSLRSLTVWEGIFLGAFLAFYAFLGFEDMVNVAEEVRDPKRNLPRAILLALGLALMIYAGVALVAVAALPIDQLAGSKAPMADVYRAATGNEPMAITVIASLAVINGILIQIIMASRLFYGMARRGWLPRVLAHVNRFTGTPDVASLMVGAIVLLLALNYPLVGLAKGTNYLILFVFMLANLALLRIRRRPAPEDVRTFPVWVPVLGFLGALLLFVVQIVSDFRG